MKEEENGGDLGAEGKHALFPTTGRAREQAASRVELFGNEEENGGDVSAEGTRTRFPTIGGGGHSQAKRRCSD